MMQSKPKDKRGKVFKVKETGNEVYLWKVREDGCYLCSIEKNGELIEFWPDELIEAKTFGKPIKSKPVTEAKKSKKSALDEFFDRMALKIPFNCNECNRPLYAFNKFAKRCSMAHILPKAEFKSVETNEDNLFFLGADIIGHCNDHDRWDRQGAENRTHMKVYQIALERLPKLLPCLTDAERIKVYTYLYLEFGCLERKGFTGKLKTIDGRVFNISI